MNTIKLVLILVGLGLILVGCGPGGGAVQTQPAVVPPKVEQPTPIPLTKTPLPPTNTPTLVEPQPGAKLIGPIEMGDKAKEAVISLSVSSNRSEIASWSVYLEGIQCETEAPSMIIMDLDTPIAIDSGAFNDPNSKMGELSGKFTAPNRASGTIHLLIDLGLGGEAIECGMWTWSAVVANESEHTPGGSDATATLPAVAEMQPVPPSELVVVNDTVVESENKVYVNGEVGNHSSGDIKFIIVTARLFDSSGSQATEGLTYAFPGICPPNERAAFSVSIDRPAAYQTYELQVEAQTTSEPAFTDLLVVGEVNIPGPLENKQICGLVENTGETTLEHSNLVGVFYDAAGKVVNLFITSPTSPGYLLVPGQIGTFLLMPYPPDTQYASYRVILEGTPTTKFPPPELEIVTIKKVGDNLYGVVKYPGPGTASVYGITAVFFDAEGKIVGCTVGIAQPQDLAPGDSANFELLMLPPVYERYELYVWHEVK